MIRTEVDEIMVDLDLPKDSWTTFYYEVLNYYRDNSTSSTDVMLEWEIFVKKVYEYTDAYGYPAMSEADAAASAIEMIYDNNSNAKAVINSACRSAGLPPSVDLCQMYSDAFNRTFPMCPNFPIDWEKFYKHVDSKGMLRDGSRAYAEYANQRQDFLFDFTAKGLSVDDVVVMNKLFSMLPSSIQDYRKIKWDTVSLLRVYGRECIRNYLCGRADDNLRAWLAMSERTRFEVAIRLVAAAYGEITELPDDFSTDGSLYAFVRDLANVYSLSKEQILGDIVGPLCAIARSVDIATNRIT